MWTRKRQGLFLLQHPLGQAKSITKKGISQIAWNMKPAILFGMVCQPALSPYAELQGSCEYWCSAKVLISTQKMVKVLAGLVTYIGRINFKQRLFRRSLILFIFIQMVSRKELAHISLVSESWALYCASKTTVTTKRTFRQALYESTWEHVLCDFIRSDQGQGKFVCIQWQRSRNQVNPLRMGRGIQGEGQIMAAILKCWKKLNFPLPSSKQTNNKEIVIISIAKTRISPNVQLFMGQKTLKYKMDGRAQLNWNSTSIPNHTHSKSTTRPVRSSTPAVDAGTQTNNVITRTQSSVRRQNT